MSPDAVIIAEHLERRVRRRGINAVVTYNELAAALGFPPVTDAWSSHPFSSIFDELDLEDSALGRPFRTALVITQETKYPGAGFWAMVLRLRFPKKTRFSDKEMMAFYSQELQDLVLCYPK